MGTFSSSDSSPSCEASIIVCGQAFLEDPVSGGKGGSSKSQGRKVSIPTDLPHMETLEERLKMELTELGLFEPPEVRLMLRSGVAAVYTCCVYTVDSL